MLSVPSAIAISPITAKIPEAATARTTPATSARRSNTIEAYPTRACTGVIGTRARGAQLGVDIGTRRNIEGPCDRRVAVHHEHERMRARDQHCGRL